MLYTNKREVTFQLLFCDVQGMTAIIQNPLNVNDMLQHHL
ncbi:unnamed protein product [Bacillus thuringiensis DB27]|uniref:Uncharacterized protein n=1 Tax=Bacillus thuringiensis DB27 TaxID=1431339 RepID=W8YCV4_BACTU|nr:unnamed protein product [Bacillus thuringiensis DB27]